MTFYDGATIHVSPCDVCIGRTCLYYTNDGAYPIIVCNGKAMIGEEGTEHCDFDGSTITGRNIEARFWVKPRILTLWNRYAPSEYMRAIGEKITEKFGVPLDKIRFIWDSFVESEDYRTIACEMPLSEYISMNPKTDLNSLLSYL